MLSAGPEDPSEKEAVKKQNRDLIKHCMTLLESAKNHHPRDKFKKWEAYYSGTYPVTNVSSSENDSLNIIKPIVETKVSLVLDAQVTTTVEPRLGSFSDLKAIEEIDAIADFLNDCLSRILKLNDIDALKKRWMRRVEKDGITIAKVVWDPEKENGLGEVSITEVDPKRFFIDPAASNIDDSNYVVVEYSYSPIQLKSKYPDRADDIDKLVDSDQQPKDSTYRPITSDKSINYRSGSSGGTYFVPDQNKVFDRLDKQIVVRECYLKDDTTWIPSKDDPQDKKMEKIEEAFKYPNGRVIIFAGDSTIFEDKALDLPFGFPFVKMNFIEDDTFWGQGEVESLIYVQDRLNAAYTKLRLAIGSFLAIVMVDELSGIDQNEIINKSVLMVNPGTFAGNYEPRILTNNTTAEIAEFTNYIAMLKDEAWESARLNKMMISGQKQPGVNSGAMVQSLIESPMASIRDLQGNLSEFMIQISNKVIQLVQAYYNVPRMMRIGDGKTIHAVGLDENQQRYLMTANLDDQGQIETYKTIKTDIGLLDYECQIDSGSQMPHGKGALGQLTLELANLGVFGAPDSIEYKKAILKAFDFPNRRAIEQAQQEKITEKESKPPMIPIDKVSVSFKDLPVQAQVQFLTQNGLLQEPQLPVPVPALGSEIPGAPMMDPNQIPPM